MHTIIPMTAYTSMLTHASKQGWTSSACQLVLVPCLTVCEQMTACDWRWLQNNGTCSRYIPPALAAPPAKLGQYCDVGQVPQEGCPYCNLAYQYAGGPPTTCVQDVSAPCHLLFVACTSVLTHMST